MAPGSLRWLAAPTIWPHSCATEPQPTSSSPPTPPYSSSWPRIAFRSPSWTGSPPTTWWWPCQSTTLQRTDTILVVCVIGVPCGDTSFERYGDLPIDSYEPSVRAVVARLALGEADLGIVYATDVAAEPRITAAWNEPPACPCVAYAAAAMTERGRPFLEFLESDRARDVLTTHGFAREAAPPGSP